MAFLPGFLQFLSMLLITAINYLVIMISTDVLEIAKDFTALMVISDFDDIFGTFEGRNEIAKQILSDPDYEKLFTIETTTSNNADDT